MIIRIKNIVSAHFLILILLIITLSIGLFTAKDYGMTGDEYNLYRYAGISLTAYRTHYQTEGEYGPSNLRYYGPAYLMIGAIIVKALSYILQGWSHIEIWHFVNFLCFQVSVICVYLLCRSRLSTNASFGSALLFCTQPLLWGHAFINPKDIPLMTFFLGTIVSGLWMANLLQQDDAQNACRPKKSFVIAGIIFAGLILGLCISVRILGPLAGVFVSLFVLLTVKGYRKLAFLCGYWTTAGVTAYATWPYLWEDPVDRLIKILHVMSNFPWNGKVLFDGIYYDPSFLPKTYLPALMFIQFTEVIPFLFLFGLIVSIIQLFKKNTGHIDWFIVLMLVWLILPVASQVIFSTRIYDNFRHILFIIPPLFVLIGFGLEKIIGFFPDSQQTAKIGLLVALAIPGMLSIITLHPYQYTYYNAFIGGVKGAYHRFELDYATTSFKEAMLYMNKHAEKDANIVVSGPTKNLLEYARPDLHVTRSFVSEVTAKDNLQYDYAVIATRGHMDETIFPGKEIIYQVERQGAVFSVIKKLKSN